MAKLGVRTVDELVGRTEYLQILPHQITQRAAMVDVSGILARCGGENCRYDPAQRFDFKLDATLDKKVLLPLLPKKGKPAAPKQCALDISCTDRAFGTLFGAEITRRWGGTLPDDTYQIRCRGGAGQSFGAFLPKGVTLTLEGDSNDYFGKGLSGGKLAVYADPASSRLTRPRTSSSATSRSTARRAAARSSPASRASGSACAIPARPPSSRASATTAAST